MEVDGRFSISSLGDFQGPFAVSFQGCNKKLVGTIDTQQVANLQNRHRQERLWGATSWGGVRLVEGKSSGTWGFATKRPLVLLMAEIRRSPVEVGSWNPIIYKGFSTIPGGTRFQPSTVGMFLQEFFKVVGKQIRKAKKEFLDRFCPTGRGWLSKKYSMELLTPMKQGVLKENLVTSPFRLKFRWEGIRQFCEFCDPFFGGMMKHVTTRNEGGCGWAEN